MLYPARRHARRLHRAQRDDHRLPARAPTGTPSPTLTGDASWRGDGDARLLRAARALPLRPTRLRQRLRATRRGHGYDGWLTTEPAPTADSPCATGALGEILSRTRAELAALAEPALAHRATAPRYLRTWRRPERLARRRRSLGASGSRRSPPPTAAATAPASTSARSRPSRPTSSSCGPMRSATACSSTTTTTRRRASSTSSGRTPTAPTRAPRTRGAAGAATGAVVRREVILAGGAFNTPQLLKLSGIGPRGELDSLGIPCRVDLPGRRREPPGPLRGRRRQPSCAANFALLDGVHLRARRPGRAARPAASASGSNGKGVYTTNGARARIIAGRARAPDPDLFIFGAARRISRATTPATRGELERQRNVFTWAILKAHTRTRAGTRALRSADPRDPPDVNFRYFDEGNDAAGTTISTPSSRASSSCADDGQHRSDIDARELVPGRRFRTPRRAARVRPRQRLGPPRLLHLQDRARRRPDGRRRQPLPGARDRNLRVVDASVFPRIPGFFIVTPDLHDQREGERRHPGRRRRRSLRRHPWPTTTTRTRSTRSSPTSTSAPRTSTTCSGTRATTEATARSVVLALTFASVPEAGVFDTDMLYRLRVTRTPRSSGPQRRLGPRRAAPATSTR